MISINIIKARVKRNNLETLSGEFYRDDNSLIVKKLNSENKKAFLGIQSYDGKYTIIGEEYTYYKTDNNKGEIRHSDFLKILTENSMNKGKNGEFEFVPINNETAIWVLNASTKNAIWNTLLLFR